VCSSSLARVSLCPCSLSLFVSGLECEFCSCDFVALRFVSMPSCVSLFISVEYIGLGCVMSVISSLRSDSVRLGSYSVRFT
jgi:hypothetical protein